MSKPRAFGRRLGQDHDHSESGEGGDSLSPSSISTAKELGLPMYDDVSNAPQSQGRVVYATGNGSTPEGIYKHDGSSYVVSGQWQEDGSGNIVPIDGETVGDGTTTADHQSLSTEESVTVAGDDTMAYGRNHGATVQGDNVVIGVGARALEDSNQTVSGNDPRKVAIGYEAAENDEQFGVTVMGYRAARDNTGNRVTAVGYRAAWGDGLADPTTMGDDNIGIGKSAIRNNQASGLIAIGQNAGINAQTDDQLIITQRDGTRRMVMDLTTGDLKITGSLTENASL